MVWESGFNVTSRTSFFNRILVCTFLLTCWQCNTNSICSPDFTVRVWLWETRCELWSRQVKSFNSSLPGSGMDLASGAMVRKFIVSQAKLSFRGGQFFSFLIQCGNPQETTNMQECKSAGHVASTQSSTAAVVACSTSNGEKRYSYCKRR